MLQVNDESVSKAVKNFATLVDHCLGAGIFKNAIQATDAIGSVGVLLAFATPAKAPVQEVAPVVDVVEKPKRVRKPTVRKKAMVQTSIPMANVNG